MIWPRELLSVSSSSGRIADRNRFRDAADFQFEVDALAGVDSEIEGTGLFCLEAGHFGADGVGAEALIDEKIIAAGVGLAL